MKSTLHLGICFAFVAFFAACIDADPEEQSTGGENESSIEQGVYSGWTSYTSEEYAPISCDSGSMMSAVQCSGWYCDNIAAYCSPTSGTQSSTYWTSYFSEEWPNYKYCDSGYWMTGFSCQGWYCDNISVQCSYISNAWANSCYWTGWISEENGGYLNFGSGYYARGVLCDGWYCDNKRFYVCRR